MPTALTLTTTDHADAWPVTVPTRWADVTLGTFVALHTEPGAVPVELLCGLPAGTLERLSVQAVAHLATLLAFATDPAPVLELLPLLPLPGIGGLSYGTLVLAQQHLAGHPDKPALFYMPRLLALYRMELLHGKYDAAKVAACEAAVLAAPVTEVYADAAFFLASYRSWQNGTPPTSPTTPSRKTRSWKRAAKSWANGSARFWGWTRRLAAPS